MKKNITEPAIDAVILAYRQTQVDEFVATNRDAREYFFGKRVGLIEAFAYLTGQEWIVAETMLRRRADALPKE